MKFVNFSFFYPDEIPESYPDSQKIFRPFRRELFFDFAVKSASGREESAEHFWQGPEAMSQGEGKLQTRLAGNENWGAELAGRHKNAKGKETNPYLIMPGPIAAGKAW